MKSILEKMKAKPRGQTKVKDLFKIENAKVSKQMEAGKWGNEGYDESVVGKKATISGESIKNNLWITKFDSTFQSTVDNETVLHFIEVGFAINKMKEMDRGCKGPIRLVEWQGKYYIHDGHHRMSAALLRGDKKVEIHLWKLKAKDLA